MKQLTAEELATVRSALEACHALFEKDHAIDRVDWGKSFFRAEDIRELNELPFQIVKALKIVRTA